MRTSSYQICKPKSADHRRGMKWFGTLARAVEDFSTPAGDDLGQHQDNMTSLQHAIQLYSVFVETGDKRYLDLSEDFLKYALGASPAR